MRLQAILKRTFASAAPERLPAFCLGDIEIDLESAAVRRNQEELPLTAKERMLLLKLYENEGRIVTSDAICQAVWGDDSFSYENTLMVHIRRIREKIEADPSRPRHLLTVRGLGYKLQVKEAP